MMEDHNVLDSIWHRIERLIEVMGEQGTQKLGIERNAFILSVVVNNEWRVRNTRVRENPTCHHVDTRFQCAN